MTKTTEQTLRDLFATGYDPVKLEVYARGINESNLEVSIAGQKYSVKGNEISLIGAGKVAEPVNATPQDGNTNSPKSDPAAAGEGSVAGSEDTAVAGGNPEETVHAGTPVGAEHSAPADDAGAAEAGQAGDRSGDGEETLKSTTE